MARVLCAYSGIEFSVEHFPIHLTSREAYHPLFTASQKRLLGYTAKWAGNELTDIDSYLLFLALLNSTDLIEWRVPAQRTNQTAKLVANNMESLIKIVGRMNVVQHPAFVLARIAITPETKTLENIHFWIQSWEKSYAEFLTGYKKQQEGEILLRRERALEKLIKDHNKPISVYATQIAEWADKAGYFPTFSLTIENKITQVNEYWKSIIKKCCKDESIFSIPRKDLEELIEHCEDNIEHGSIYAFTLMELLRTGLAKQKNYLGLGDIDLSNTSYTILSDSSSVEDANKIALINSAPENKPIESAYPSKIAFLRAKLNHEMAQKYRAKNADFIKKLEQEEKIHEEVVEELDNLVDDSTDTTDDLFTTSNNQNQEEGEQQ